MQQIKWHYCTIMYMFYLILQKDLLIELSGTQKHDKINISHPPAWTEILLITVQQRCNNKGHAVFLQLDAVPWWWQYIPLSCTTEDLTDNSLPGFITHMPFPSRHKIISRFQPNEAEDLISSRWQK